MNISVIMPVYNKALYLEKAVNSVLLQTNIKELIIIDDGSTDGSADILNRLAESDSRIILIHQQNAGVSAARNVGISLATGDYIHFLDGDDTVTDNFYKHALSIINLKSYDILFFSFLKEFNDSKVSKISVPITGEFSFEEYSKTIYKTQTENGFFGFISNKIVKKEVIGNERFLEGLKLAEDLDFWLRIYPKTKVSYFSDFSSFNYVQFVPGSSIFDTVDCIEQLRLRKRYENFYIDNNIWYDKDNFDKAIAKYVVYCIEETAKTQTYVNSLKTIKLLKDETFLPCNRRGLKLYHRYILYLSAKSLFFLPYISIKIKSFLGKIKRCIKQKLA